MTTSTQRPFDDATSDAHSGDMRSPQTAEEKYEWLPLKLRTTLANLQGAPEGITSAVVQLLPFGSRAALISLGLAKPQDDNNRPCGIVELTPSAYEVIRVAARHQEEADGAPSWVLEAKRAADFSRSAQAAK